MNARFNFIFIILCVRLPILILWLLYYYYYNYMIPMKYRVELRQIKGSGCGSTTRRKLKERDESYRQLQGVSWGSPKAVEGARINEAHQKVILDLTNKVYKGSQTVPRESWVDCFVFECFIIVLLNVTQTCPNDGEWMTLIFTKLKLQEFMMTTNLLPPLKMWGDVP